MKPNSTSSLSGVLLLMAAALQLSCGGGGTVSVLLTDAPGDFKRAVVTIDQIYLQRDDEGGRVVLRESPVTTDLLTLANGTAEVVRNVDVPAGTYSQLRFVISGAYVEVDNHDGTTSIFASSPGYSGLPSGAQVAGDLQLPSFDRSGLKVDIGTVTVSGSQRVIVVDFDVAQSFGHAAASTKWVMHPVVKGAELNLTCSVEVKLTPGPAITLPVGASLSDWKATLTNAGGSKEALGLSDPDGDGTFAATFMYLLPGTFVIDFEGPNGNVAQTDPAGPTTVTLISGEQLTRDYVLIGL